MACSYIHSPVKIPEDFLSTYCLIQVSNDQLRLKICSATKACSSSQTEVKDSIAPTSSLRKGETYISNLSGPCVHSTKEMLIKCDSFFLAAQKFLNGNVITQKNHNFCPSKTQDWFRYDLERNARKHRPDSVSKTRK